MRQYFLKLFIACLIIPASFSPVSGVQLLPDSLKQIIRHHTIEENAGQIIDAMQKYALSNSYLAIELGNRSLKKVRDEAIKARIIKSMAVAYYTSGNKLMADSLFYEALIVFDSLDMTKSKAEVYNNIGLLYYDKQNYNEAINYLHRAQEINHILGDTSSLVKNLSNIARCYTAGKRYKDALRQLNTAHHLALNTHEPDLTASILTNLGDLYHTMNNHQMELEYHRNALAHTHDHSNHFVTAHVHLNLAGSLMELGQYDQAKIHLDETFKLAASNGFLEPLQEVYELYAYFYEKNGDLETALQYYKHYQHISDSLNDLSEANKVNAISSKYQYEIEQREQEILQVGNMKNEQRMNRRTMLIILLAVILILVLALFMTLLFFSRKTFKLNRTLKKQKAELQNLNKRKDEFFSFVAHDLKNPVGNIMGFSELLGQRLDNNDIDDLKRYTHQINESAKSLDGLIDNLLDWSRLTRGKIRYEPGIVDISSVIQDLFEYYKEKARNNGLTIVNDVHETVEAYADKQMVSNICNILMSNAIKYNKEHGHIYITTRTYDNKVEVRFKDTGVGIKHENLNKLFRIDVKKTDIGQHDNSGGGLGLILAREMVIKNNGEIMVESEPGKGSVFSFTLPQASEKIKDLLTGDIRDPQTYLHQLRDYHTFPAAVKNEITQELIPQYHDIKKVLSVDDLIRFSERIEKLGQHHQIKPLENYGRDLLKYSRQLKFDKILVLLPAFEQITDVILSPELNT